MIPFRQRVLAEKTLQFYLFACLTVLLPLLVLVVLGFAFLWQQGWLLWFGLGSLLLALVMAALGFFLGRSGATVQPQAIEQPQQHLPAAQDWSDYERGVWHKALLNINDLQLTGLAWPDLPHAMLQQLTFVGRTYHQHKSDAEYAFTVPELMLMLEICGREYRALVLTNVPLSQLVKVSEFMRVSRTTNATWKFYKKYSLLFDATRALLSGGASVPSRIASALMSEVGSGLSVHMQRNMKQLLFEQVSQVAIDLYSGRLKLSAAEMAAYRSALASATAAESAVAAELAATGRPLTVLLVGQVNAGKSSLVNALKEQSLAEVDVLPSTAGFHHYQLALNPALSIRLVDSPGLDGDPRTTRALLKEAGSADLLLWLCQANQPAKALDKALMTEWDWYFKQHLGRKKPPVLLVTTHNDQLPPASSWQPPYDLADTANRKAQAIAAAARYARQTLGLDERVPVLPIALKPGAEAYNLDTLRQLLLELSDAARAAQLNRERFDAADSAPLVAKCLAQTAALASSGIKLLWR